MHALYCRLLHLHHAHDEPAINGSTPDGSAPAQPSLAPQVPDAQTAPTVTSAPRAPMPQRTAIDRDRKPSLHTLIVPRLIEAGYTLDQISDLTGVPQALVELIADEPSPAAANIAAAQQIADFVQAKLREAELARRRRSRIVAAIVLAAVVNIVASIASVIWHIPVLGAAATVGSCLLILAVFILARRTARGRRDSRGPDR